jgi:hypothetical protein
MTWLYLSPDRRCENCKTAIVVSGLPILTASVSVIPSGNHACRSDVDAASVEWSTFDRNLPRSMHTSSHPWLVASLSKHCGSPRCGALKSGPSENSCHMTNSDSYVPSSSGPRNRHGPETLRRLCGAEGSIASRSYPYPVESDQPACTC